MSSALYDSVVRIARHESRARAVASVGKVTDVMVASGTPPDLAVSVELRDSGLVLPRVPVAVGVLGFGAPPDVDDLVVVVFLEGDVNAPICVGRLYHPDEDPPPGADRGKIALELPSRAAASDKKLKLLVDGAAPLVTLTLPDDVSISIDDKKIELKAAEMAVSVDTAGGGRVEVAAGGSTITLKKDGDVAITAKGNLKLEGNQVEISGQSKVKISGAAVDIN